MFNVQLHAKFKMYCLAGLGYLKWTDILFPTLNTPYKYHNSSTLCTYLSKKIKCC
jgi:hypothetical protein